MAQKSSDITSKNLIAIAPGDWVRWATDVEDASGCEVLNSEFQMVSRNTDALVMVRRSSVGQFLALFEIQTRYSTEMPLRMRAYAALAEAKFQLPVFPILVNILPYGKDIPTSYETEFLGLKARQDYRVINLWEVEAEEILARDLTALIPFIPTMKGGTEEKILHRAQTQLEFNDELRESGKLGDMEMALQIFAKAILGDEANRILRWTMIDLIMESPFYKEIVDKGVQQGLLQGLQQESQNMLVKLISHKFGNLEDRIKVRLQGLSVEQSENLAVALLDFESVDDLTEWLSTAEISLQG